MSQIAESPKYKIYAVRYATSTWSKRGQHFISDERPEESLGLDFYFWAIVGDAVTIIVDTGMAAEKLLARRYHYVIDPTEALQYLGIFPETVKNVIITHLHFDHIGNTPKFTAAKFLLQEEEIAYATGPAMCRAWFRAAYDPTEISRFVGYLHSGRLYLHGRDHDIIDGISVHWVGGHTGGQEVVRVRTARGWVVLASDALHYYEELERRIPYAVACNLADMVAAHDRIRELSASDRHIIPGHDPKVIATYPALSEQLAGKIARVDLAPSMNQTELS